MRTGVIAGALRRGAVKRKKPKLMCMGAVLLYLTAACDKKLDGDDSSTGKRNENQQRAVQVPNELQNDSLTTGNNSESQGQTGDAADSFRLEGEISDLLAKPQISKEDRVRLHLLLLQMVDSNPEKLLEWMNSKYPQLEFMEFSVEVMRKVVAKLGKERFYAWAATQNRGSTIMRVAWSELLAQPVNESSATETIAELGGAKNHTLLLTFFRYLAMSNPDLAISSLDHSNLPPKLKIQALGLIASNLAFDDPARAYSLLTDRKENMDSGCLPEIAAAWVDKDSDAAFEAIGKLDAFRLSEILEAPICKDFLLQKNYINRTMRLFDGVVLTGNLANLHERAMLALATVSTEDALKELESMDNSPYRSDLLRKTFSTIANRGDWQLAVGEANQLVGNDRTQAMRGIVAQIAGNHFEEAVAIASKEPEPQAQDLYREIARTVAYSNPVQAVSILEDNAMTEVIGSSFRSEMLGLTVQTWAKQDLQAAQQWVETLPAADAPKGVHGLMSTWMKSDPVAASAWLSNQPVGAARDAGARVVIDQIKDTDPEMAEKWQKSLSAP